MIYQSVLPVCMGGSQGTLDNCSLVSDGGTMSDKTKMVQIPWSLEYQARLSGMKEAAQPHLLAL